MSFDGHDVNMTSAYLIDKFDGIEVHRVTGEPDSDVNSRFASSSESVRNLFLKFPKVGVIEGVVPDVLGTLDLRDIGFLHVDLNAARPEVEALKFSWPDLLSGSIIILDYYGFLDFRES